MRNNVVVLATDLALGIGGVGGGLPWPYCAEDLREFSRVTKGKLLLLGRSTYEEMQEYGVSWGNRIPFVLTTNTKLSAPGIPITEEEALELLDGDDPIYIIGGGSLYNKDTFWVNVGRVFHTIHEKVYQCDTYLDPLTSDYMENNFERVKTTELTERVVLIERERRECQ